MELIENENKGYIGTSEIGMLILAGCDKKGVPSVQSLNFENPGEYYANLVTDENFVPSVHPLNLQGTFYNWLKIYDDAHRTFFLRAPKIKVYKTTESNICFIHAYGLLPKEDE